MTLDQRVPNTPDRQRPMRLTARFVSSRNSRPKKSDIMGWEQSRRKVDKRIGSGR